MDSISMCSITLYMSNMDVGSSLRLLSASTQPCHNHIILTPQVKVSPAQLILIVSLDKCLQSMSEVWQSVTWVYQWHMHIDGIMCNNRSMLGHKNSKLVENRQKSQPYTHLKHWCHIWHSQRAGYSQFFFKLSGYHVVSDKSRVDHSEMVFGPFENLTNLVLDPLLPWTWVRTGTQVSIIPRTWETIFPRTWMSICLRTQVSILPWTPVKIFSQNPVRFLLRNQVKIFAEIPSKN